MEKIVPTSTYVFEDATPAGDTMLSHLAGMYDPFTQRRLAAAKVPRHARCLVIAAGASTVASRLADLAPDGEVIATDTDPRHIPDDHRVTVKQHNIVTDPLPGTFDLIHVRLLLGHLPQRLEILAKLADTLNPGGALFVEEFQGTWDSSVLSSPSPDADRLFAAYHAAFLHVLRATGNDPAWGRQVHGAMLDLGLDADTEGHTGTWSGGTHGCLLPWATSGAIRAKLVAAGMAATDVDDFRQLLLDKRLRIKGNLALSTLGRRSL
jgi:SAM-dependent methyltransferase